MNVNLLAFAGLLVVTDLLYRVFAPTVKLCWQQRRLIREALWIRVRHPHVWAEARAECQGEHR